MSEKINIIDKFNIFSIMHYVYTITHYVQFLLFIDWAQS